MLQKMRIEGDTHAILADDLILSLELESDGKKEEVVSSHIDAFELEFFPYGFDASLSFTSFSNAKIEEIFNSDQPITVSFSYQGAREKKQKKEPMKIKGIAWERLSRPIGKENEEEEVSLYKICFSDALKVCWSTHYPYKIYIKKTLKDVLDEEKNALVDLDYDFDAFNKEHAILALGLNFKKDRPHSEQPSFYDFLNWVLHLEGGILEYNYQENKHKIVEKKTDHGKPIAVSEWWVTPPETLLPRPKRNSERVIKHAPDQVDKENQECKTSFDQMFSDYLDGSTYVQFPEQNDLFFKGLQAEEKVTIDFSVRESLEDFHFEQFFPGSLIVFKGGKKIGRAWSENSLLKDKTYRLKQVVIKGEKSRPSELPKYDADSFLFQVDLRGEEQDEGYVLRPRYIRPLYPFSILGTVFCTIGEKEQTTYNVVKDEQAPLGRYEVMIPIGGEEKKVVVPFSPDFMTGQHYFPLCKGQQVILDMHFRTAKIKRIVNWQPLTELPEKVQGCQVVYGSNGKDKYFYQKHEYVDGKNSVMTIKQSSSENQTQVIEIKEKMMTFTVEEKGKRTVVVRFDRDQGLFLQVDDQEGGVTNQTAYTEKEITHTSKGDSGTSTVVQKPDGVEIECKKFTVKCEESTIDAKKTITNKAGSKVINDAPIDQSTTEATIG